MNTIRMIAMALPMMLLLACGGGGGGSGTAVALTTPTTPTPVNPLAGLANVNVAAENSPTIRAVERITGMTGVEISVSAAYQAGNLNRVEGVCPTTTTCFIPIPEFSPSTLAFNISNPQPSLFLVDEDDVTGITSRVTEGIMLEGDNVTLARGNSTTTTFVSDPVEFRTFAGWIDGSIFFGTTQIQIGETNPVYRFVNHAVGVPSGTDPSGTGSATWEGATFATVKADRTFLHGDATITIADLANPVVVVKLENLRDISNPETRHTRGFTFRDLSLDGNGVFTYHTPNPGIEGRFYGTDHAEVGGWFNDDDITGAFGGTRQTGQ